MRGFINCQLRIMRGGHIATRRAATQPRRRRQARARSICRRKRDGRIGRCALDRLALPTLYPRDLGERLDMPLHLGGVSGLSPPWRGSSVG